ncbi:MAG TPA: MarR family transcriptional regulator [Galbitalea sp.]|jgi:DNA-binding MarR family transcriptional regulator
MSESATPKRDALPSRWRGVRELFARMDDGIPEVYEELGVEGVRPRFSMAIMLLDDGPLSIRQLAREVDVTHSAMSQTVSAMRESGLIASTPGKDARSRMVELTEKGRALVPVLRAEWDATEAALAELEDEVPYALSLLIVELREALDRRSFADRLRAQLDAGVAAGAAADDTESAR